MLTDSKIRSAKTLTKSYKLADSLGLYLTVSTHGSKLWYFRYRFQGKENRLALGVYPLISLAAAREKRDAARKLLASGVCPSLSRKAEKAVVEGSRMFQSIAINWHSSNLKLWSQAHADKIMACNTLNESARWSKDAIERRSATACGLPMCIKRSIWKPESR